MYYSNVHPRRTSLLESVHCFPTSPQWTLSSVSGRRFNIYRGIFGKEAFKYALYVDMVNLGLLFDSYCRQDSYGRKISHRTRDTIFVEVDSGYVGSLTTHLLLKIPWGLLACMYAPILRVLT